MHFKSKYYAHGKLLITGEYTVLDGALALAIPTSLGQSLNLSTFFHSKNKLKWVALDVNHKVWFTCLISDNLSVIETSDSNKSERLITLLRDCLALNPNFGKVLWGQRVETHLEFNRHWGLGSSSTLISLISQWADINPYELLHTHFKGSGYDVACANAHGPILYQLKNGKPTIKNITFKPSFIDRMFFIYLNKKQLSHSEVTSYTSLSFDREILRSNISELTKRIINGCSEVEFCEILESHEKLLGSVLNRPLIKHFYSLQYQEHLNL